MSLVRPTREGPVAGDPRGPVRSLGREELPAWPLALPFASYGAAWLLGLGDMIWPLSALVMVGLLLRTRNVRVPPGFGIWMLFVVWMSASVIGVDSAGRLLGFMYRASLYVAATVIAVYAYNAVRSITIRYVCGVMVVFLATMAVFGYLALAFPLTSLRTPLALVLPGGLQSNDVVRDMVVRELTQFNPDSWIQTTPRPSAPFLYANTWGNVFSLVWPLALLYAWLERTSWRGTAAAMVAAASVVPAFLTLNRGMFVGLSVVAFYIVLRGAWAGRFGMSVTLLVGTLVLVVGTIVSPVGARLGQRLEAGSSTGDRLSLYSATLQESLKSPLFGYGAPRPATEPWLPSLGTQGQLWTVVFSHGVIALVLFLLWFAVALGAGWRRAELAAAVLTGTLAATLAETIFYGMLTGLNISLLASALVFRTDWPGSSLNRSNRRSGHSPPDSRRA